jgi:HemK-like putative methylase
MVEEPQAYSIGCVPFLSTNIFLDSRPLIPRTETEYWVQMAITDVLTSRPELTRFPSGVDTARVLDLCAGSGCVGTALLQEVLGARVDFVEIDSSHHQTIKKNLNANGISQSRARIYGGSLFDEVPKEVKYDLILSNPPYIDPARIERVEEQVLAFEPALALLGGEGGMEYIERIIIEAPAHLARDGVLYIEHEPEQVKAIHKLARKMQYSSCQTNKDQYGLDRYTRLQVKCATDIVAPA